MRPKNPLLRYAFRAAKAKLLLDGKKVTVSTLTVELETNFKTIQRFLYRDRDLAEELGIELEHTKHDLGAYTDAIVSIPSDRRPTVRRIAAILDLDHSSVARFLKAHTELRMLHPRFDKLAQISEVPEEVVEPEESPEDILRWRDMAIAVWHEGAGRYVGGICYSKRIPRLLA